MDRSRDEFLARAALATDDHRGACLSDATHRLEDLDHGRMTADQFRYGLSTGLSRRRLCPDIAIRERRRQQVTELVEIERLYEKVDCTGARRLRDGGEILVGGHHDDVDVLVSFPHNP